MSLNRLNLVLPRRIKRLLVCLWVAGASVAAAEQNIVFVDGSRMVVQSYELNGGTVEFTTTDGKLRVVPSTYIDLAATGEANGDGGPSFASPAPAPSPPPRAPEPKSLPTDTLISVPPKTARVPVRARAAAAAPDLLIDGPPAPEHPEVLTRDEGGRATLRAVRLSEPLDVDGSLEERAYATTPAISGFIQQEPLEGRPATEETEVWVFYDESNIYFSARLWDSHPERIIANEMRRDNRNIEFSGSSFAVILDTFYDRRNGFLFQTNPLGALYDAQVTDERNTNSDWNTIWYVKSGRFAEGWTVEMAIPFKSLRYRAGTAQIWGVNFQRIIKWKNERSYLTPMPAAFNRDAIKKLSVAAALVGVEPPAKSMNLEIKPYVIGSSSTNLASDVPFENRGDADVGFDVKYGVTKSLVADVTYNTDFAQVEDDESQVNLTRFGLFFPEKREFFLEGQGIFNFGGRQSGRRGGFGGGGQSDTPILFFSRRIGLSGSSEVPILTGGRLTGRAGPYSLGLLNISTRSIDEAGIPQTNFSVVRIKRDVFRRSTIGFIGTYRNNNLDGTGSNSAYGLDGNFTFYENLNINAFYARTDTPDAVGGDTSYRASVRYRNDLYGFDAQHLLIDPSFNPEIGFVRRDDIRKTSASFRYSPRPRGIAAIRQFEFEAKYNYLETTAGDLETKKFELKARTRFESGDFSNITYDRNFEFLFESFEISDGVTIPVGGYTFDRLRAGVFFSSHRPVSGWVGAEVGSFFSGTRTELSWRGRIDLSSRFSLEPNLSLNWIDLAEGAVQTNLIRLRATYTMSPRSFMGALVQYNSEANSLSTNVRFRWEYRPGSDLFVVYSDGRNTLTPGYPGLENRSIVFKVTRLFRF